MKHILVKQLFCVSALLAITACGGGAPSTSSSQLLVLSTIVGTTLPPVTDPIAVGSSVTITLTEQTCRYAKHGTNPPGQGCGEFFVPTEVSAVVQPKANTGAPCGVTLQLVKPGTFVATRTAPGDPIVTVGTKTGGCEIDLRDLGANGFGIVYV